MRLSLFALAALCVSSAVAHADLIGSVVDVQNIFPNIPNVQDQSGYLTVSNGTSYDSGGLAATATFSADTITVTADKPGAYEDPPFNGFNFLFTFVPTITYVVIDPRSNPLASTGTMLSFSGDDIMLNLGGTCSACSGGEQIILDVTTQTPSSITPEPSSLVLLSSGIVGVAGVIRRRLS